MTVFAFWKRLKPRLCHTENCWWLLLALVGPAVLYSLTLAPSIVIGDSAEFQTEAWRLGVTHPTGYPLYLLLGRTFSLLPLGEPALRLNAFSMLCALCALACLFDCLVQLTGRPWSGVAGAWLGAVGSTFWSQALIAEVYALHALIVFAALAILLRWYKTRQPHWIMGFGLTVGLGLAHHRTIVFLLIPAALYVWLSGQPRPRVRTLLWAACAVALPLLLYLYVPLRWPEVYGRWPGGQELFDYLLGRGYSYAFQPRLLLDPARWIVVWDLLRQQLLWPGLVLVGLGLMALARHHGRELLLFGLVWGCFFLFGFAYQVPDVAVFFIPAWLLLALFAALGVDWLSTLLARFVSTNVAAISQSRFIRYGVFALSLILPIMLAITRFPELDRSDDWAAHRIAEQALVHPPMPHALVVCDFERLSALRYAFAVRAPKLDIEPTMPDTEAMAYTLIDQAMAAGRPVYLARPLPAVAERYRLSSRGPLAQLTISPGTALPADVENHLDVTYSLLDEDMPVLALRGYQAETLDVPRGQDLFLTLYWQALFDRAHVPQPYQVTLRLLDEQGQTVLQGPTHHPVEGQYPLNAWSPGQVVADYHRLAVDPGLPPGEYTLAASWALPYGGDSLSAPQATVAVVRILANPQWQAKPQQAKRAKLVPALSLFGFDLVGRPVPGRRVRVTAYLRARQPVDDLSLTLYLGPAQDRIVASASVVLDRWPQGEVFPVDLSVLIPPETQAAGGEPWMLWLSVARPEHVPGPWLELAHFEPRLPPQTPGATILISLDDKMMLLSHELPVQVAPGDPLRAVFYWWAMSDMSEDYVVFVHLLDAEGRVRWQQDIMPALGTRPTSGWQSGKVIQDMHEIPIPSDAETGTYRVEVGVYSPLTWQRLQVLDADGQPQADHFFLPSVQVGE